MTTSAFRKLFTRSHLNAAWKEFWKTGRKNSAPGVDGLTPADFQRNIEYNLDILAGKLRSGYSFSPLRPFPVPKSNGKGERLICVPTVADRLVQRILISHLRARPGANRLLNSASYGFIKGRGVTSARDKAIELRKKHQWAYKSDISSFFDNIPRIDLIDASQNIFRQPSLKSILLAAASCEIEEPNQAVRRLIEASGIRHGHGIRQGMPISPMLSNVILENFDRMMLQKGYNLVRYADDFIVLSDSYEQCLEADGFARELLCPLGLSLPTLTDEGKTQISSPEKPVEFLGLSLEVGVNDNYELKITQKQQTKIVSKLALLRDPENLFKDKIPIHEVGRKIQNMVGGYRTAYSAASNVGELEDIFAVAVKDTTRRLYEQAFGKSAVDSLKPRFRAILGLEEFPSSSGPRVSGGHPQRPGSRR